MSKYKNSILYLIVFLAIYFGIMFGFKGATNIYSDGKRTILVTIDSLITTSTISFVAFTNYASSASGSSQVIRKISWASLRVCSIGKRTKLTWIKELLFPATVVPLLLSILITLFDIVPLAFVSDKTMIMLYLYSNVIASSLIMIFLIIKYIIFNKDSYQYSANALVYHFNWLIKYNSRRIGFYSMLLGLLNLTKNPDILRRTKFFISNRIIKKKTAALSKTRSYCRNHLNPLKNTKNETLVRTISRQWSNIEKYDPNKSCHELIFVKLEKEIILNKERNVFQALSLLFTLHSSSTKLVGKKFSKIYETITLKSPWYDDEIYEILPDPDNGLLESKTIKKVKESFSNTAEIMRLDHNIYVFKSKNVGKNK